MIKSNLLTFGADSLHEEERSYDDWVMVA